MAVGPTDSLSYITSPLAIDSLFYWFDASQGVTDSLGGAIANNEGVGTWNDLSGHGYHVTQTTNTARPVYKTGALAGYPGIQFDGSNDYMKTARHWWGSDDLSIFTVVKYVNATRNAYETVIARYEDIPATDTIQWVLGAATDRTGTTEDFGTQFTSSANGATTSSSFSNYDKSTAWTIVALTYNGSDSELLYADGSAQTWALNSTHAAIFNASGFTGIGAVRVNSGPVASVIQGTIAEIIMYAKVLSTAERTAIETYLNRKYDLY